MEFDRGDYIAATILIPPAIAWSWVYPVGVLRYGWNRFSWKATLTMIATLAGGVVGLVSMMAGTWTPAMVMSPLILATCSASVWLGFRAAKVLLRSMDAEQPQ